jgi:hypothetical protein
MVVMVVVMAEDPTRHPHDDTAVMMVVMVTVAAVMVVMTHADINLRHLHVGFIAGRSRVGRPQCSKGVGDRIEQFREGLGRRHADVLNGRRGGLRAAGRGQPGNCADDTNNCFFHGAFPLG